MTEQTQNIQIDTTSRNRIVAETDYNFFVEAGAGSGKTTMLVNRMVAMIEQGKDIRKICAITFTKAAANEFYERFQKILVERSNPNYQYKDTGRAGQLPPPTDETRKRCAQALQNIDLCFMGTIDSFCNMILSEHPSEAGIPSDAVITSDAEMEGIYKQEYVKICEGAYGQKLADLSEHFRRLNPKAENVFVKGMQFFMNNRSAHINYVPTYTVTNIDVKYKDIKATIQKVLSVACNHTDEVNISYLNNRGRKEDGTGRLMSAVRTLKSAEWGNRLYYVLGALEKAASLRFSDDILQKGALEDDYFKKVTSLDCCFHQTAMEEFINDVRNIRYHVSMTFLKDCVWYVEKTLRENGRMTYFDYLYYLRNMLRDDAAAEGKLIRYIYERHSYFLIDEFQDTNPMQAEVFFYLTAVNPVKEWHRCIPKPGSLFIVGDPKQSIYRFRSADVASYLNVKELFTNSSCGEVLYLFRNFRSRKILCEYFNRRFDSVLKGPDEQELFSAIPIVEDRHQEFEGIFRYQTCSPTRRLQYPDYMNEVQIANIIDILVNNEVYRIYDEESECMRPIQYKDIMVIEHRKDSLVPIMQHLNSLGIPTEVEGKVLFGDNEALREVVKIYRVMANSKDKIALYGALTGKVLGITDGDIFKYTEHGGKLSIFCRAEEEQDIVTDDNPVYAALIRLAELYAESANSSPAALFSYVMDRVFVYSHAEVKNMEVLCYALELLRSAEKAGTVCTVTDAVAYLDTLLSGNAEEERCLSLQQNKQCVKLANLHKVKGLEAPVVILSYWWPGPDREPDSRIQYENNGTEGYLFALDSGEKVGFTSLKYFSTHDYQKESEKEKTDAKDEHERLVYVAATRARNALILCDNGLIKVIKNKEVFRGAEDDGFVKCGWRTLLDKTDVPDFYAKCGRPAQGYPNAGIQTETDSGQSKMQARLFRAQELYEKAVAESALRDRGAEEQTYRVELPSHVKVASKLAGDETEPVEAEGPVLGDSFRDENACNEMNSEQTEDEGQMQSAFPNIHKHPALLGTMVHRLMEMLVSGKNMMQAERTVEDILREYLTPVSEPYANEFRGALLQVAQKMRNGGYEQTNGVQADVLKTLLSADEVHTEVPFCYKDAETSVVWHGVMDVIYATNGEWHILDYKTNADGSELDEEYKEQMKAYVKAFKEIMNREADAKTYHIAI